MPGVILLFDRIEIYCVLITAKDNLTSSTLMRKKNKDQLKNLYTRAVISKSYEFSRLFGLG